MALTHSFLSPSFASELLSLVVELLWNGASMLNYGDPKPQQFPFGDRKAQPRTSAFFLWP